MTATIDIDDLEVLVLKQLVLVNHMLAKQLVGAASRELMSSVRVLNDIVLRADAALAIPRPQGNTP